MMWCTMKACSVLPLDLRMQIQMQNTKSLREANITRKMLMIITELGKPLKINSRATSRPSGEFKLENPFPLMCVKDNR